MKFRATSRLDRIFEVGILLTGLDVLMEVAGGIFLLLIKPEYLNQLATTLTQHEFAEDPRDFFSTYILHATQNLSSGSLVFAALYLLSHGVTKIVLICEILHNRLRAYLALIYLTIGFMIYQIYRFSYSHSAGLVLLTLFDAVIVYLTVVEYRKRQEPSSIGLSMRTPRRLRSRPAASPGPTTANGQEVGPPSVGDNRCEAGCESVKGEPR